MATVIKISSKDKPSKIRKVLNKATRLRSKGKKKLSDFYGKMPNLYGDGLTYQKKVRNEW
jgi:hypothetical protein